jgi:hypothetical protein
VSVFQAANRAMMLKMTLVSECLESPVVEVRDLGSSSLGLCS